VQWRAGFPFSGGGGRERWGEGRESTSVRSSVSSSDHPGAPEPPPALFVWLPGASIASLAPGAATPSCRPLKLLLQACSLFLFLLFFFFAAHDAYRSYRIQYTTSLRMTVLVQNKIEKYQIYSLYQISPR